MTTVAVQKVQECPRSITYLWEALTASNNDGAWIDLAEFGPGELSVQIIGTFSAGTITMQGSNDGGTTAFALDTKKLASVDQTSGAADYVAAALSAVGHLQILERPRYIRPLGASADTDDVDVYLHIVKAP